jgi:hypothetical protein
MLRFSRMLVLLWALVAIGFFGALIHLFKLRYESGDVYPPYSSFRADPMGTKAYYESLSRLEPLNVQRNLEPVARLSDRSGVTLFFIGLDVRVADLLDKELIDSFERVAALGGRVVISFSPETAEPWTPQRPRKNPSPARAKGEPQQNNLNPEQDSPNNGSPEEADRSARERERRAGSLAGGETASLAERWGVRFTYVELPDTEHGDPLPVNVYLSGRAALPSAISWQTALCFDTTEPAWREIYSREDRPVMMERIFGKGSVILSADSYFLSNQALRQDRHPELLAWLAGTNTTIVFDETHLGVALGPGVAALARQFRLHGVLAALLLLAGLFVWKNTSSLVPRLSDGPNRTTPELVGGRDAGSGFVNLLRRSIPSQEVIFTCFEQWRTSQLNTRSVPRARIEQMESVVAREKALPGRERNPVAAYCQLSQILTQKNQKNPHASKP